MQVNGIEIIDDYWIGNFGFIKGEDTITKEIVFFAGEGNGKSYEKDIQLIVALGSKYNERNFYELVKWFSPTLNHENYMLRKMLEEKNMEYQSFCQQVKEKVDLLEKALQSNKEKRGNKKK